MTEMTPLGVIGTLKRGMDRLPAEARYDVKIKQGHAVWGVDLKLVDDAGRTLPQDGKSSGVLMVRGPWIASAYFRDEQATDDAFDEAGWFSTGDVATVDPDGFMHITDRAKDVIRSGGEWISSIDLENVAVGHPDVAEAAVIGVRHPKWGERPLLIAVPRAGAQPAKAALLDYMRDKVASWALPDDVVLVDELPHTATGKLQKTTLRQQYQDYRLPTV
jgi:fatty-acyl-CoA synthase